VRIVRTDLGRDGWFTTSGTFLKQLVNPGSRRQVVHTEQLRLLRDLAVKYVIPLQLEVEQPLDVPLVCLSPAVVVGRLGEAHAAEYRRNVIKHGS